MLWEGDRSTILLCPFHFPAHHHRTYTPDRHDYKTGRKAENEEAAESFREIGGIFVTP